MFLKIYYLKNYLFEINDSKCQNCGWGEINEYTGKTPLEVDHIDGDSQNNSFDNLRLLCPNCHSQTATFGSKNRCGRDETVNISLLESDGETLGSSTLPPSVF